MLVEVEHRQDVCVVRFSGRIAAGAELELLGARADEIKKQACSKLLADMRHVSAIGSTGIGFLVNLYSSVTKAPGGRFVLVGAGGRVREVLDLTRLSTILPLADDLESGLAYLRAGGENATAGG
jgi:anti-anti-sigma factor